MFQTNHITQSLNSQTGKEKVIELPGTVQRRRIEDNMVVYMLAVNMGRHNKGMVAFQKAHGQLSPYFIGFLRCDLTGLKRLANLIGNHIMLLLSTSDVLILPFGKQKFFVRSFGVTFIGTDKLAVVGLCRILRIVRAVGKTLTNCFSLIDLPLCRCGQNIGCRPDILTAYQP